jgi:hypothetical protein
MSGTTIEAGGPQVVVNQMYRECLDLGYRRDYYQEVYSRTVKYAKMFDYSIGLGSAATGGTGLGILASSAFAWVCAIITTVSVFLSIAKGVWDWSGKLKFALDRTQFYEKIYDDYRALVDDVSAEGAWNAKFAERRVALRGSRIPSPPDPYPQLSLEVRRAIQNRLKAELQYHKWWMWHDDGA